MVDLWVQDESRIGQQGSNTRMWGEKGSRPRAIKQGQFNMRIFLGRLARKKIWP